MVEKKEVEEKKVEDKKVKDKVLKRFDINNDFIDLIRAVERIREDITLVFEEDKIICRTVDPAHVVMTYSNLSSENFSIYEGFNSDKISFNIDLFKMVVNTVGNGIATIKHNTMHIKNGRNTGIVTLQDIDEEIPKIPGLSFDVTAVVEAKKLLKIIRNAKSDYIKLVAEDSILKAKVENDISSMNIYLTNIKNGSGIALYSCEYLEDILSYYKKDVKLSFSTDKPIEFTDGKITYLLAPRIED